MNTLYFNQKYLSKTPIRHLQNKVLFVPEPWLFFRCRIVQFLCHLNLSPRINSKIALPFRSFWIKKILKKCFDDKDDNLCIIINSHFYHLYRSNIDKIARRLYKNVRLVFAFSDRVSYFQNHYKDFPSIEELKSKFDLVMTYNLEDSTKFNLVLERPCFPLYEDISNKLGDFESDLFFVGSNKGRLDELYKIYDECSASGVVCDFHITGVPKDEIRSGIGLILNEPISYSEVLERSKKTKCILYLVQKGGDGIVLRDYEALSFNKLLLTNNKALLSSGLYTKEQVIWINEIKDRICDIKKGYSGTNSFKEIYSLSNWLIWLENALNIKNL